MGQSPSTLLAGNLNANALGSSITADQVTEGLNLATQTAIVTGGTSGLGKETARVLAKRGAHVVIAGRKMQIAKEVKDVILQETPNAQVDYLPLDLSDLGSIRTFVNEFESKNLPLNILVNNAGVYHKEFIPSSEGIEYMFATHVLGNFLLTQLLLEKMKTTAKESGIEGRIMITGSEGHRSTYKGGIDFNSLRDPSRFNSVKAYGQSKVGAIVLTQQFAKRLKGTNVVVNSGHPGTVSSELGRNFVNSIVTDVGYQVSKPFIKTPEQGAATLTYVATRPEVKGVSGKYWSDCTQIEPSKDCTEELGEKVWNYCSEIVGTPVAA